MQELLNTASVDDKGQLIYNCYTVGGPNPESSLPHGRRSTGTISKGDRSEGYTVCTLGLPAGGHLRIHCGPWLS